MRILYIVPYVPTPIRVRPYQLLHALLRGGHQVTLATVCTSDDEWAYLEKLTDLGVELVQTDQPRWRSAGNSLGALFSNTPLQAVYSWQPSLAKYIKRRVQEEQFDVVHVEHLRGARYGVELKIALGNGQLPVVWDSVDCISHLFEQAAVQSRSLRGKLMARLELARTRRYEGWLVHQFDQVVVTSPTDRDALEQLASYAAQKAVERSTAAVRQKIAIIPNGVDLDYFEPNHAAREPAGIVFSGKMSYHANVTAAIHLVDDIMPRVWAQRPEAKVWIVGQNPTPEVQRLASPAGAPQRQVIVTGSVPDIRPYLRKATLAVAPMPYGAGIQNKVLEAMACATPVVASRQAASALETSPDKELIVADGHEALAKAICGLLDNPTRCQELGAHGRAYVERHHSWDAAAVRLDQVYRQTRQEPVFAA